MCIPVRCIAITVLCFTGERHMLYVMESHQSGRGGSGYAAVTGPMGIPNDVIQLRVQLLAMQLESSWH